MHLKHLKYFLFVLLIGVSAIVFNGCAGDDGSAGATGATGHVTDSEETCVVCHTGTRVAGVEKMHPALIRPTVTVTDITEGGADTVSFTVMDGTTPVTGLKVSDVRFYFAAIIPATTVADVSAFTTTGAPAGGYVSTWATDYMEMYLEERSASRGTTYPQGTLAEPSAGNYVYTLATDLGAIDATWTIANMTVGGTDTRAAAPDFASAINHRLFVGVDARNAVNEDYEKVYNRTMGVLDFAMPSGSSTSGVALVREIVAKDACTDCHNDPLERAAHGGSYQSPQVCVMCHTPLGNLEGDVMQKSGFWLASLVHNIHSANATGTDMDFSAVTYPKDIRDCAACHDDAVSTSWKANPSKEACSTCHQTVVYDGATAYTSLAGNAVTSHTATTTCSVCHTATGTGAQDIVAVHNGAFTAAEITPVYTATIAMTPPTSGTFYVAGEAPVITVTTDIGGDYTADYTAASLYVYGPRAEAVPVLTTGSTTDPAFITALAADPTTLPTQGHDMLDTTDPLVATTAAGFVYNLQAIPADLEPGTYMVQVAIGHSTSRVRGSRNYKIDGWALQTFQVGTATAEKKIAGDCTTTCHNQAAWGSMYHRSYFGTDGCIGCHDNSGNHANMLANRVHAVHSANSTGDLLAAADWTAAAGGAWTEIEYPQSPANCVTCHNSGSTAYSTTLKAFACYGCHIGEENVTGTENVLDHFIQNGYDVVAH
jgi:OmcA/MtrC family decaheme c-type cytochrome